MSLFLSCMVTLQTTPGLVLNYDFPPDTKQKQKKTKTAIVPLTFSGSVP